MIGDTPYDIQAAARAGMPAIALRCGGGWSEQDLAEEVGVYDDPLDLLLHYDDSPLVRSAGLKPRPATNATVAGRG
jgi:phosphoglycolate phosphatase-like HAD superfamily hydrolase